MEAVGRLEQGVCHVGLEGRIKVDEIDALIGDMLPHDVEVVSEVEAVAPIGG